MTTARFPFYSVLQVVIVLFIVTPAKESLALSNPPAFGSNVASKIEPLISQPLTLALPSSSSNILGKTLTLEPMLGRYPPHRASSNIVTPIEEIQGSLDSITDNHQPTMKKTQFIADAPVHILRSAWPRSVCIEAINAAEHHNKWSTGRHHLFPTTDVPAANLPLGMGSEALNLATDAILPAIAVAFDVPLAGLYFKDMFLAKYEPAGTGQPGLGRHTDGSAFSFNMLLSNPLKDFKGGGTWIEPVGLVKPGMGDVLLHRGSLLHEGCKVTKGCRHVLVGFVQFHDDDDTTKTGNGQSGSELLMKSVESFPLGMVLEVDEGDTISCATVVDVAANGAASRIGIQKGDCVRGIFIEDRTFTKFDGRSFDHVMDMLVERRDLGPLHMVIERWCSIS